MTAATGNLDRHWEDYRKRRRSFWKTFLSIPLLMALCAVIVVVAQPEPGPLAVALAFAIACGLLIAFVVYLRAWFRLLTWPCPVCGRCFASSWWSTWPTNTCKHCGAELGSTQQAASPNGGPAPSLGNSEAAGGPPSVS